MRWRPARGGGDGRDLAHNAKRRHAGDRVPRLGVDPARLAWPLVPTRPGAGPRGSRSRWRASGRSRCSRCGRRTRLFHSRPGNPIAAFALRWPGPRRSMTRGRTQTNARGTAPGSVWSRSPFSGPPGAGACHLAEHSSLLLVGYYAISSVAFVGWGRARRSPGCGEWGWASGWSRPSLPRAARGSSMRRARASPPTWSSASSCWGSPGGTASRTKRPWRRRFTRTHPTAGTAEWTSLKRAPELAAAPGLA